MGAGYIIVWMMIVWACMFLSWLNFILPHLFINRQVIVEQYTPEEKKAVMWQYIALFKQYTQQQSQQLVDSESSSFSQSTASAPPPAASASAPAAPSKVHVERVLSRLITPMLSASLEKGQSGCLDAPLVEAIVSDLLQVGLLVEGDCAY